MLTTSQPYVSTEIKNGGERKGNGEWVTKSHRLTNFRLIVTIFTETVLKTNIEVRENVDQDQIEERGKETVQIEVAQEEVKGKMN